MQMHRDGVRITMGQFTKFYYGFSFVTICLDGLVL